MKNEIMTPGTVSRARNWIIRARAPESSDIDSTSKKRPKKWLTRVRNCTLMTLTVLADRLGNVFRNDFHVFVLDQLSEDLFKRRKVHQAAQPAHAVLGFDFAFIDDDDFRTDPFDDLENVGDVE